ncbi:MAG: hypothetical protein ACJ790_03340 [Myxococcaceae bacterium]
MSAAPETIQRQNLERLQTELATRDSTLHFAHAAVSCVIGLILVATSAKLVWDARTTYWLAFAVFCVACVLIGYGTLRYLSGRAAVKHEQKRFDELTALRAELHLDDPSRLLPPQ